jgi:hypothetical protein
MSAGFSGRSPWRPALNGRVPYAMRRRNAVSSHYVGSVTRRSHDGRTPRHHELKASTRSSGRALRTPKRGYWPARWRAVTETLNDALPSGHQIVTYESLADVLGGRRGPLKIELSMT